MGVNANLYAAKSQTFFLWGGGGINKYIPGAITGYPTESRSFRGTINPFFRYADAKGNSHKILTRFMRQKSIILTIKIILQIIIMENINIKEIYQKLILLSQQDLQKLHNI